MLNNNASTKQSIRIAPYSINSLKYSPTNRIVSPTNRLSHYAFRYIERLVAPWLSKPYDRETFTKDAIALDIPDDYWIIQVALSVYQQNTYHILLKEAIAYYLSTQTSEVTDMLGRQLAL